MASIDTLMEGSPASVDETAAWLESLERVIGAGGEHGVSARRLSQRIWSGSAADGYRGFAADLVTAHDETEGRAHSAADTFRSYALQLKWRQEDMHTHRSDASTGGLVVAGTRIHEPRPLARPAQPGDDATPHQVSQYDASNARYETALQQMDLFRGISGRVQGTYERLDDWIVDNLVPEEEQVNLESKAGVIAAGARALPDFVVTSSELEFARRSDEVNRAARARAVNDAASRSGNPAVRAGRKPPREQAVLKRVARRKAPKFAQKLGRVSKGLGILGVAISVGMGGYDIAAGASPSGVALETVAGLAGGAVVVAGAAALAAGSVVAAPVVVVAGVAVIGGVAASYAAGWAYEKFVPQATREKIDEGLRDAGSAVGGFFKKLVGK